MQKGEENTINLYYSKIKEPEKREENDIKVVTIKLTNDDPSEKTPTPKSTDKVKVSNTGKTRIVTDTIGISFILLGFAIIIIQKHKSKEQ